MKNKLVELGSKGFIIARESEKNKKKLKKAYIRKSVADALVKAKDSLGENYNFKIFEGKRPLSEQRAIVKCCAEDFKNRYPNDWNEMLIKFTGGYEILKQKKFAPHTHLGGGAIDLTIIKGKREIDMGGIKLDDTASLNYYEKKKNLTKKEKVIRRNRLLLKKVMTKVGFISNPDEWWHWGYKK